VFVRLDLAEGKRRTVMFRQTWFRRLLMNLMLP
jgi:hypothetical protein